MSRRDNKRAGRVYRATPKKICRGASEKRRPVSISSLWDDRPRPYESPNNLSRYRWRHELPSPERDAELVRLAKSGDRKARAEIVRNYHRTVLAYAGKHRICYDNDKSRKKRTNGARDDLLGRGFLALWEAVLSYDESKGRFSTYAKKCISGQISKEATTFIKRGSVGETRIERWLFAHPRATPWELVAAFRKKGVHITAWEATDEIKRFKARCSWKRYREPDDFDED